MELYQQTPLAIWNTARDVWETPQTEGLFCEHSDVFSETWPSSVSMRKSAVYALPTWEPAMDDSGYSCSHGDVRHLPTPTTRDYKDTQIRREPHRPDDTDTLSRALADLI